MGNAAEEFGVAIIGEDLSDHSLGNAAHGDPLGEAMADAAAGGIPLTIVLQQEADRVLNASRKLMPTEGVKADADKPRIDLVDSEALIELAKVLTFGAKKYAPHNWRKGIDVSRLIAATERHLLSLNAGEDNDPETGLSHAAHAMCNCMFLIWMLKHRRDKDDRWQPPPDFNALAKAAGLIRES